MINYIRKCNLCGELYSRADMVYVYPLLMCKPCSDTQKKKSAQKIADKAGVSVEAVGHARQTKPAVPKESHRQ